MWSCLIPDRWKTASRLLASRKLCRTSRSGSLAMPHPWLPQSWCRMHGINVSMLWHAMVQCVACPISNNNNLAPDCPKMSNRWDEEALTLYDTLHCSGSCQSWAMLGLALRRAASIWLCRSALAHAKPRLPNGVGFLFSDVNKIPQNGTFIREIKRAAAAMEEKWFNGTDQSPSLSYPLSFWEIPKTTWCISYPRNMRCCYLHILLQDL